MFGSAASGSRRALFHSITLEEHLSDSVDRAEDLEEDLFMKAKFSRVVAFLFAMGVLLASAYAQTSNGTITGTVTDKTGGAINGATVTIVSIDRGGETRATTTDASGTYRIGSLLPGKYRVSIQASGFSVTTINDVEVRGSLETSASAELELSSASATVTVEASAGQELQTQSGDLSGNIATAEVENLPYGLTGNPIELLLTEPGVQSVADRDHLTNGVAFSVNGTRPRANNFLIDGQDNNDSQIAGQAVQTINHEAIGEVTILTNSASAEFGRGGGSVTNEIFKGGTNNWHGSAWDINQPSKLSAIPADVALSGITRNPVQITNTFGFSIGGPIKKNKLFFFGTPQWNRFRANAGANAHVLLLPTANGVATLQAIEANEGANPNIDYLLAAVGGIRGGSTGTTLISAGVAPNGTARPAVEFGNVLRGDTSIRSNDLQWDFRVDYMASDHDQLTARYFHDSLTLTPDFFNNPGELPNFETQQGGPSSNFHAAWAHTVNSRMINELRFSYATVNFGFEPTQATLTNGIGTHFTVVLNDIANPDGTNTFFGLPGNEPAFRDHQTYQFQDGFSWSFGKHTFKFGGDVALVFVSDGIPVDPRGRFTVFRGVGCGGPTAPCSSLANYIDNFSGKGGTVSRFFGNTNIHPFAPNYAPYVEDTWRIKSNLTLDLGLRYEFWGTPENSLQFPALGSQFHQGLAGATFPGAFSAQEQPDKNNFAPRVGIAYTPHFWNRVFGGDRTVFRAGYGIFYDGLFTNILDNTAAGSPNGVLQNVTGGAGRGFANASTTLLALQPTQSSQSSVITIASNLRNPLTHQWNVDIQRQLPGGLLLTAAYVGTRGEHLFVNQEFNPGFVNPNFGLVSARTNGGDSIYHAGQLTVEHPFKHGLLVRGAYTYSKFIDDMSEVFTTSGLSSRAQSLSNQGADRGLSAFDRRHRFSVAYLYDLPYVHNNGNAALSVLSAITRDWQTSGTLSFASGAPETISVGFDNNGDGFGGNDRPSLGNASVPINYSQACLDPNGTCNSGVGFSLDGVHFADFNSSFGVDAQGNFIATKNDFRYIVVSGKNGNIGRNTFISPGSISNNISVQRTVKFKERYAFMIRGEFYNAFNHPNLGIPTLRLTSQNFGDLAQTINGGRTVILWGKFSF
jgi:Carboxypeptidase regulatory-like domain/TonB-dependent Receptor Plug Domain